MQNFEISKYTKIKPQPKKNYKIMKLDFLTKKNI